MLRLVSSNSPAHLATALAAELRTWREQHGPFAPAHVVVPHKALSEWLMNELSEREGAVLNLHRVTPQALTRTEDETGLVGRIYAAFTDETYLGKKDNAFVRKYVDGEPEGAEPGGRARRRKLRALTLSQHTAALFRSYREESPGFLESDACPAWQRLLWKRVCKDVVAAEEALEGCQRLFVFDVAAPTRAFIEEVRQRASDGCHVTVFARLPAPAPVSLQAPVLDEALEAGAALRKLWTEAGADEVAPHVLHAEGAGALPRLQSELTAGPLSQAPLTATDGDLRFVEAPSLRRECEWVAADIWRAVQASPAGDALRFHDVAVIIPRGLQEQYLPVLGAALQEAHKVPRVEWDGALTRTSRVARAARELLDLPLGALSRAQVVSLLQHPAVCGLYEDAEPGEWDAWLDAVGIFHGANGGDHAGTYLDGTNAAHWDQGLRRLALGAFLVGERSGSDGWFEHGKLRVEERTQSQHGAVATLVRLARSIVGDAHFLRRAVMTPAEWVTVLKDYLAVHLQPTTPGSLKERGIILRTLDGLADFDAGNAEVPYEVVHALAVAALEGMTGQRLGQLGQGVVVGSPESLRGVPFRRVYVMGLESGALPGRDRKDELDARAEAPHSQRLESCAAFVDLVSVAREGLVLSRVSKDALTGEDRAASTLFHEMREWVGRRAGSKEAAAGFSTGVRLLRAHEAERDADFAAVFPEARAEAKAMAWGRHARANVGEFHESRDVDMPQEARAFLRGITIPSAPPPSTRPRQVSLSNLRYFLECPVDGYARFALRMSPREEDRSGLEDEPFELSHLERATLVPEVVEEVMYSPDLKRLAGDEEALTRFVEEDVNSRWARRAESGRASLGELARIQAPIEASSIVNTLEKIFELTEAGPPGKPDVYRFGRPERPTERGTLAPPVVFPVTVGGTTWNVELTGHTRLLLEDTAFIVQAMGSLPNGMGAERTAKLFKKVMRNWLDHLALCASGNIRDRTLVLAGKSGLSWLALPFDAPAIPQAEAISMLQKLVAPLLDAPGSYRLPFAELAVYRFGKKITPLDEVFSWNNPSAARFVAGLGESLDEFYEGFRSETRTEFNSVRKITTMPNPTHAQVLEVVERLELFLSRCTQQKEA